MFQNAMEIFKLLNTTNCRECGEQTCLAFASSVFTGKLELSQCPYLSTETLDRYQGQRQLVNPVEEEFYAVVQQLQKRFYTLDLAERATCINGSFAEDALTINIMGKPFTIDQKGKVATDIHVNLWVLSSALHYINYCQGIPLTANWVPFRELPGGNDWYRLFGKQCEEVLKKTADAYPDLFQDLVETFSGRKIENSFNSDIAVVLFPMPLVPMLICYWKPEDEMESSLNVFFDDTAAANIGLDGLYNLGTGIARMLKQMAIQHGAAAGKGQQ